MKKIIKKITIGITAFAICASTLFGIATPVSAASPEAMDYKYPIVSLYKGDFKYKKYKYNRKQECIEPAKYVSKTLKYKGYKKLKSKSKKTYVDTKVTSTKNKVIKTKQVKYTKSKSIIYRYRRYYVYKTCFEYVKGSKKVYKLHEIMTTQKVEKITYYTQKIVQPKK